MKRRKEKKKTKRKKEKEDKYRATMRPRDNVQIRRIHNKHGAQKSSGTAELIKQGFINLRMYPDIDSYTPNNSTYDEVWRSSPELKPPIHDVPRSPMGINVNQYPMTTIEIEPLPNMFTFSPCGPPYKEFAVYKEKSSQDIADALLTLKNAVVRPTSINGQLSPISPTMHISQTPGPSSSSHGQHGQTLAYTVNHGGPCHHGVFSPQQGVQQYGMQQYSGDSVQPQTNMFPSMSVNVSMSMNVGVPTGMNNNQFNYHHQNWQNCQQQQQQPPQQRCITPQYQHSQYNIPPISPQYSFTPNTPYTPTYSITSEICPFQPSEGRNFYYRPTESYKDAAKICAASHWKRSKFFGSRHAHTNIHCDSSKVNLCRICGKTYARPSTLKTHLRTHSGEKPYKCSTCSKSFSQAANLTAHLRTHSGEKPFRCPICDRRFSQSSSVTTHMRTHSGERPYRCRLCKKAFSDSSTLTKHLRIHSGEKPYQCKLCLLRFSQSGNLNRHMRVHANST